MQFESEEDDKHIDKGGPSQKSSPGKSRGFPSEHLEEHTEGLVVSLLFLLLLFHFKTAKSTM